MAKMKAEMETNQEQMMAELKTNNERMEARIEAKVDANLKGIRLK
jgi:hypothetical protein